MDIIDHRTGSEIGLILVVCKNGSEIEREEYFDSYEHYLEHERSEDGRIQNGERGDSG